MRREEGSGRAVRQGEQSPGARLDAALRPFARRVRGRWLAEGLRAALTWGLASAFLPLLAYRTVGWAAGAARWALLLHPLVLAGAAFLAGFAGSAAVWLRRRPGPGEVALAVDSLGLEERVTSAWYALVSRHPAAPLLEREALEALARLDPRDYPVVPSWRRWRGVGLLAAALLVLPLLPNPAAERAQARAREREAVARARAEVAALAARWEGALPPEALPLSESVRARLDELLRELDRAEGAAEAAAAVAAAREELARLPSPEDVARAQTLSRLAQAWAGQPRLAAVAQALAARDPAAVRAAVAELAREAAAAPAQERQELALALQAAANESRGVPDLAAAFREAARELAAGPGEGGEGAEGPGGSAGESPAGEESDLVGLGEALADLAAGAAGLQALVDQVGALAALEAGLSAGGAGVAPGAGAVAGGGAPAGGAAGGAGGLAGAGAAGAAGGAGGLLPGGGAGGGGSGGGGDSAGVGSGAGAGGGPGGSRPGPQGSPAGGGLPGGAGAPSLAGPLPFTPEAGPELPGGQGERVQAPGRGRATGEVVTVPDSPLAPGAVRPYEEVYATYAAQARQSLSGRSLPPELQALVQRYFSGLAPAEPAP